MADTTSYGKSGKYYTHLGIVQVKVGAYHRHQWTKHCTDYVMTKVRQHKERQHPGKEESEIRSFNSSSFRTIPVFTQSESTRVPGMLITASTDNSGTDNLARQILLEFYCIKLLSGLQAA